MNTNRLAVIGAIALSVAAAPAARAQYTADYQTNIISAVTSNWGFNDYYVGYTNSTEVLLIQNGGVLKNGNGYLGFDAVSSNNSVVVTGANSLWNNHGLLSFGRTDGSSGGSGNSLVISNGGQVVFSIGYIGEASSNNSVLVSGSGSVFGSNSASRICVGDSGSSNSLVINNGGKVLDTQGLIGYFGDNNSMLVSDNGSVWSNGVDVYVGYQGSGNSLVISNGGTVFNHRGWIGVYNNDNSVVVSGSGSVWSNQGTLTFGYDGSSGNSLVINNGGQVFDISGDIGDIGYFAASDSNSVLVSGSGSVWNNQCDLYVGNSGSGNSLVISNGGQVVNNSTAYGSGYLGYNSSSSNNSVRVADGAVWRNNMLYVGYQGSSNLLVVVGGAILTTNLTVGFASATCDNTVQLDSGSVIVTNASANAVLEVRAGTFILNGGVLQADKLVMTNACARFIRNGGTLSVGSLALDPNMDADGDGMPNGWEQAHGLDPLNAADANVDSDGDGFTNLQEFQAGTDPTNNASALRIIAITREGNDVRVTWTMGSGKTNALQVTAGDATSGYTNNFADLFTVTNTVGTVTDHLELGGATNFPGRYYRVRLVP